MAADPKIVHEYTTHDFSAVNHHVDELSRRASVTTSARRAGVFKTYAIYASLFTLVTGICAWLILLGVAELLDPKPEVIEKEVVVEKPVAFEPNIFITNQGADNAAIDSTRDEARSVASEVSKAEGSTTYNFVIFKQVPFTKDGFEQIHIGMRYEDSDTQLPDEQWCYIERDTGLSTRNTIYLARIIDRKRINEAVTPADAVKMSTTTSTLLEAQRMCKFR